MMVWIALCIKDMKASLRGGMPHIYVCIITRVWCVFIVKEYNLHIWGEFKVFKLGFGVVFAVYG